MGELTDDRLGSWVGGRLASGPPRSRARWGRFAQRMCRLGKGWALWLTRWASVCLGLRWAQEGPSVDDETEVLKGQIPRGLRALAKRPDVTSGGDEAQTPSHAHLGGRASRDPWPGLSRAGWGHIYTAVSSACPQPGGWTGKRKDGQDPQLRPHTPALGREGLLRATVSLEASSLGDGGLPTGCWPMPTMGGARGPPPTPWGPGLLGVSPARAVGQEGRWGRKDGEDSVWLCPPSSCVCTQLR